MKNVFFFFFFKNLKPSILSPDVGPEPKGLPYLGSRLTGIYYIAVITENQMEEKIEHEMERDFVGVWCLGFRFWSSKYRTNY